MKTSQSPAVSAAAPTTRGPAAVIRGLNVSFGAAHILKNVSLDVPANAVVGLVGESGSGKSTLGKTLVGINTPSTGQILIHGEDVTKVRGRRRHELRREVQ
ncbi:MAG: ATP-binding cassette domain-containing protein, partial [Gemmatimonadales bacterium]